MKFIKDNYYKPQISNAIDVRYLKESAYNRLIESKEDIQKFIDKFGEENYKLFKNSNQRLKNANLSTDILWYVKNLDIDELEDILSKLRRRLKVDINDYIDNQDNDNKETKQSTGIRGKYSYLGEKDGYKVYQPLDYLASVDLGYMSGWCTTGRYEHAGQRNCKPNEKEAKKHFEHYAHNNIKLYYFLDSKTMEGKYAVALYPGVLKLNEVVDNYYLKETNFKIYNQKDDIDYTAINKIPLSLIPEEIIIDAREARNGFYIKDNVLIKGDDKIEKAIIPNNITSIGSSAFIDCDELTEITIPDNVTSIESYAFEFCTKLASATIGNGLTTIGDRAFHYCRALTSVNLPNSVTTIGHSAFQDCSSLTSITIPDSVTSIRRSTFSWCTNLTSVIIPSSVTRIGSYAFSGCKRLTSIIIPNSVKRIGSYAFEFCTSLTII